jgi:hypothetical protein
MLDRSRQGRDRDRTGMHRVQRGRGAQGQTGEKEGKETNRAKQEETGKKGGNGTNRAIQVQTGEKGGNGTNREMREMQTFRNFVGFCQFLHYFIH